MKIALAAMLMLAVLTGCSSRDEDAFLAAVHDSASSHDLETFTDSDFITTGDIACGRMEEGEETVPQGRSEMTGVAWSTVWFHAKNNLC